jgi:hypothetical protein
VKYVVLRAALPLAVAFGVMVTPVYAAGPNPFTIQIRDGCDAATFNANTAIGPGACLGKGAVTFAHFLSEATQLGNAPQWQFVPATLHMTVGQSFVATNVGGEVHTFTEVKEFGGGIVPFLNTAAGATTLASACTDGTPDGTTPSGVYPLLVPAAGFAASVTSAVGAGRPLPSFFSDTEGPGDVGHPVMYQCCIHPWMHEVLTVDP